jgi:hypothetical protein
MSHSSYLKPILIAVAAIAALALLRYEPWRHGPSGPSPAGEPVAKANGRPLLRIGFLPVT